MKSQSIIIGLMFLMGLIMVAFAVLCADLGAKREMVFSSYQTVVTIVKSTDGLYSDLPKDKNGYTLMISAEDAKKIGEAKSENEELVKAVVAYNDAVDAYNKATHSPLGSRMESLFPANAYPLIP